ncbi:MAG: hypothetical protein V3R25_06185, partial [Nitrosomonadaceae bacterium]
SLKERDPKKWRQYLLGLWRRHQHKPAVQKLYQSKLTIAQQILRTFVEHPPHAHLPVTFDHWYTQPAFCRFLDKTLQLAYVGTLAKDDQVIVKDGPQTLGAFATHLRNAHQHLRNTQEKPIFRKLSITYKGTKETYDSYCTTHTIHNFGKQRLVINHREADLSDSAVSCISNRPDNSVISKGL